MDGIAAIGNRIATIQATLDGLRAAPLAAPTAPAAPAAPTTAARAGTSLGTTTSSGTASQFASALAAEVTAQAGGLAPAGLAQGGLAPAGPAAGAVAAAAAVGPLTTRTGTAFTQAQVDNAAAVVGAGQALGLSLRDQAIGVMTALGESSLRVLDRGDKAGPDSRGLFQQRDNGAWGSLAERMDPTASATSFFRALARVGARETMSPTLAAHAVQRNADPQHYARYWGDAVDLTSRLTGTDRAAIAGR
ncbi:hypothetical protein [Cellulomonas fimi]|uniref:Uncharacterized protein n=1 Tax=Cellulomonas fimi TaxID=1708 RepID=A0A7Y0QIG8_CELFI|nr:hypothetical protein [Cellulomonas fimi]NMR20267.1 hypothetical protein [Cellulomonas fimi]